MTELKISVGCTDRRNHARNSGYGSREPCKLAAPLKNRRCEYREGSPLYWRK